jgi:N-dimethylarginine dimethylaminohydrolase
MKPGSVNQSKAKLQWQNLVQAYRRLGVKVNEIIPSSELPDMVFACDQGLVTKKKFISGRFRHHQRQPESSLYQDWFKNQNYDVVTAPKNVFLEGGETLPWAGRLLMGTGFRTSVNAAAYLEEVVDLPIVSLKLIDKFFYHLDTCLFPLNDQVVYYYPPAFAADSRALLQALVPQLIEFEELESRQFAANSVVVDHHVLLQPGCPQFENKLTNFGYKPIEVDVSQFNLSGGGIHCLTLHL